MRILLTVHCFYPKHIFGTETYTLEIAKTLLEMGHQVTVLTTNSHVEPANGRPYVRYEYEAVPVISLDTTQTPNRNFRDTYCKETQDAVIEEIIREFKPDIIHSLHTINLTVSFLKKVREMGIPAIATMTDFFGVCFNCKLQRHDGTFCTGPNADASNCLECYFAETKSLQTLIEKSGWVGRAFSKPSSLAKAAKIPVIKNSPVVREVTHITERKKVIQEHYETFSRLVAPTNFLGQAYVKNGYPQSKVTKLTFGLNRKPVEGHTEPRKDFSKDLTFGYIGQLYWHKGVDMLVEAFNRLGNPNHKLKIYGDLNQDYHYTEKLKSLKGDNPNIELLGTFPRDTIGPILRDIDVLVIPSLWYENAPLVLLNALSTRTPVIVSDVDGMNEFIRHDDNGMLFAPGDANALYEQLKKCEDDPAFLERISEQANYEKSIRDNVQELFEIYEQVIKQPVR